MGVNPLDILNVASGVLPMGLGIIDRIRARTDPYMSQFQGNIMSQYADSMTGQNPYGDAYGGYGMFGQMNGQNISPYQASFFNTANMLNRQNTPQSNYMNTMSRLSSYGSPQLADTTQGMASMMGRRSQFGGQQYDPMQFNQGGVAGMGGTQDQAAMAGAQPSQGYPGVQRQHFGGGLFGAEGDMPIIPGAGNAADPLGLQTKHGTMQSGGGQQQGSYGGGGMGMQQGYGGGGQYQQGPTQGGGMGGSPYQGYPGGPGPSFSNTGMPKQGGLPQPQGMPQPAGQGGGGGGMGQPMPTQSTGNPYQQLMNNPMANAPGALGALEGVAGQNSGNVSNNALGASVAAPGAMPGLEQMAGSGTPSLMGQVQQSPMSLTPQVQQQIYGQGMGNISAATSDLQRRMRQNAAASGNLNTGEYNQGMLDTEYQKQKQLSDLGQNIGIEAARTNFGDLMGAAGLQQSDLSRQFGNQYNVAGLQNQLGQQGFQNLMGQAGLEQGMQGQRYNQLSGLTGMQDQINQGRFGNLTNTAGLQAGTEQALGNMNLAQNEQQQGQFNNDMARYMGLGNEIYNAGMGQDQMNMDLYDRMTRGSDAAMQYQGNLANQATALNMWRLQPSEFAQLQFNQPVYGGGGGGGSSMSQMLPYMGSMLGNFAGGGY